MTVGAAFLRRSLQTFCVLCLVSTALAQSFENGREVTLENPQVRVLRVSLAPHSKIQLGRDRDTVVIHLDEGQVTLFKIHTPVVLENAGDNSLSEIIVELKQHWDTEFRSCAAPAHCTHETGAGGPAFARTTTLFSNGFVTVMDHKVGRGGTLSSSYYSARGSDRILLVALTNLHANFDGIDQQLETGQAYFSAATEVEIGGQESEARWIVIRLHIPGK